MDHSRRSFLGSALTLAGIGTLSPAMLASCLSGRGKSEISIDFIGSRESYDKYREYFRGIRKTGFVISSLERTLAGNSNIAFLEANTTTKPAWILMLIEKGMDVLTTYPLCHDLGEFANISEFIENHGRHVGLINPLMFYPSFRVLRKEISAQEVRLEQVRINCHPQNLAGDFSIAGTAGTAQALQRIVSITSDSYPLSLKGEADSGGELLGLWCRYEDFELYIHFDGGQTGWNMELTGEGFAAVTDHTGMLAVNNEVEPRLAPDPAVLERAVRDNLEDFLQAVRERTTPLVNQIDGLSALILSNALTESLETGSWVSL